MHIQTFSALAEPNRLQIVELLRENPRSVNEIVDKLHLNQPQVSKHLKVLSDAGFVEVHPQANKRVYELSPQNFLEIDRWIETYTKLWEVNFDRLEAMLKEESKKKKRGGVIK